MNLIERVKNILITPKTEWEVINSMGTWGLKYIIASAVIAFIAVLLSFYLTALIVDMLAPSFKSEKNMSKSAQLVAYSGTPSYIGLMHR